MNETKDDRILQLINDDSSFDKGFELLVGHYQEKLYWHIRHMVHIHQDADDVLQNVFVKIFKHIKSFKAESKLYTWLYRIATNEAITFINKKRKRNNHHIGETNLEFESQLKADPYFDADQAQMALIHAVELLPEKQKIVFKMRYYQELPYEDISQILEVTTGSLKASFHHAIKKIENHLKENMDHV